MRVDDFFDEDPFEGIDVADKAARRVSKKCDDDTASLLRVARLVNQMDKATFTTREVFENVRNVESTVRRKLKVMEANNVLVADRSEKATVWHKTTVFDPPSEDATTYEVDV